MHDHACYEMQLPQQSNRYISQIGSAQGHRPQCDARHYNEPCIVYPFLFEPCSPARQLLSCWYSFDYRYHALREQDWNHGCIPVCMCVAYTLYRLNCWTPGPCDWDTDMLLLWQTSVPKLARSIFSILRCTSAHTIQQCHTGMTCTWYPKMWFDTCNQTQMQCVARLTGNQALHHKAVALA